MFNVIRKFKFSHGRFSCATSFPSAINFSLLEFNHFSSSAANAAETNSKDSNPEPFSAVYLKTECGFSPKKALIYSKYLKFDSREKPLSVVAFLKAHHFTDSQISRLVEKWPLIFRENLLNTLLPNVEILREAGVPDSHIAALLRAAPRRIAVDPASFRATVDEVLKLGFSPLTKGFITGLIVMRQLSSSSWKEKIEYYQRWGWSEHQVRDAIRKNPRIMATSKDKIAKILDFLINRMACDISVLTTRPVIMLLSFEERIAPRYAFYQVLLSKGLIKGSSLGQMLICSQRLFFKRFVQRYEEKDPELLKLYEETFSISKD